VLFVVLIISGIFTLVNIPSIIKYGNAYTQMLQEAYGEDDKISGNMQRSASEVLASNKLRL
jgi:hypothetical protein